MKLCGECVWFVGLVLFELQNLIFFVFVEIVGGVFIQNGYMLLFCMQNVGGVMELDYVDLFFVQQVFGVIFLGGNYMQVDVVYQYYECLCQVNFLIVFVNVCVLELLFVMVLIDDVVVVEQVVLYVYQFGYWKIGLLFGLEDYILFCCKFELV